VVQSPGGSGAPAGALLPPELLDDRVGIAGHAQIYLGTGDLGGLAQAEVPGAEKALPAGRKQMLPVQRRLPMKMIRKTVRNLILGEKADSRRYVDFLRKKGVKVGVRQISTTPLFLTAKLAHTPKTAKNLPCFLNSAGGFGGRIL
jgi:hypothetical protein